MSTNNIWDQNSKEFIQTLIPFARDNAKLEDEHLGFNKDLFEKFKQIGIFGLSVSEDSDGTNQSNLSIANCIYAISQAQLSPAIYISVHLMVSKLIEKFSNKNSLLISELASGQKLAAFCLTESSAGSDAQALQTKVTKSGNDYIINGEKIYITSAGIADVYLVFAKDDESKISAFIVNKENPGLSFGSEEKKMGAEGSPISSVVFDNCKVKSEDLLGQAGEGFKIALSGLNSGRINIAAAACGISYRAIEIAKEHLNNRKQFGQSLSQFQGLQFMIAEMETKLKASILLTIDAAKDLDKNPNTKSRSGASMAKYFSTESAMKICTDSVQILGGAGYLRDYGVEQLMRNAKMLEIVEGTNQIQKLLIAKESLNI